MSNVVLIGFMGTGKSTIGRLVAEKLNRTFLDSDKMIEKETGTTINNIFSSYGESYFREIESKVIHRISQQDNCVIATGGGVVLSPDNMKHLRENGIIICLKAKPEIIYERTKNAGSRPLLNVENPASAIEKKLNERKDLYIGDLVLDTSCIDAGEAADRIVSFVCEGNN
ncbi:MAG: shikimate kinase [Caulobacteraceae bacterium]